ncbi:MAG: M15 family metallopeptidase [Candidatus Arcticimaribacter sp.]
MKDSLLILLFSLFFVVGVCAQIPEEFGYIKEEIPSIVLDIRYATKHNFMGRVVNGYASPKVVLTQKALSTLKKAQADFKRLGFGIKIFDAYRPQKAVDDFMQWIKAENDTLMKHHYYPHLNKSELLPQGYIASKSGHSRGSTLDLTLIYLEGENAANEVDMGGEWDFFGKRSNYAFPDISAKQKENRALLRRVMSKHGFIPYAQEWWHFTLAEEAFPEVYFNF